MDSKRQQKFSKLIQKELADIFQKEARQLFGNTLVTITDVKVTPDLGLAKIYLSFLNSPDKDSQLGSIRNEKSKIRNLLGRVLKSEVRTIPDLQFFIDDTADYAARMDELFAKIQIPPGKKNQE